MAQRWEHPEREVPVGSLIKPFLAVAYGRTHASFSEVSLRRKNRMLASPADMGRSESARRLRCPAILIFTSLWPTPNLGLPRRPWKASGLTAGPSEIDMVRQGGVASPLVLAKAYLELANHFARRSGGSRFARDGVVCAGRVQPKPRALSCRISRALAKTGTALCTHPRKASGDGFALVMSPADHPRIVLLCDCMADLESMAAGVAGRMIAAVESEQTQMKKRWIIVAILLPCVCWPQMQTQTERPGEECSHRAFWDYFIHGRSFYRQCQVIRLSA